MPGGAYGDESTLTRSEVLKSRGYTAAAVAGNGAEPELEEPPAPARPTCALAGCAAPLPPRRRRYCSTSCAAEAERLRLRAPGRPRPPVLSAAPSAAAAPTDAAGHPLVEFVAGLLAAGVGEVEVTIAGAAVVARALQGPPA